MMSVIGPAPNLRGETITDLSLIAALTTIGVGGRSAFAYLWSLSPQEAIAQAAVIAQAATAAVRGVLRIAGLWLLILDPGQRVPRGRPVDPAGTLTERGAGRQDRFQERCVNRGAPHRCGARRGRLRSGREHPGGAPRPRPRRRRTRDRRDRSGRRGRCSRPGACARRARNREERTSSCTCTVPVWAVESCTPSDAG